MKRLLHQGMAHVLLMLMCFGMVGRSVFAYAMEPGQTPTPELQEAIGVIALRPPLVLYDAPHPDARQVDELHWGFDHFHPNEAIVISQRMEHPMQAHDFFLSYLPKEHLALLPVVNELENGWVQLRLPHATSQAFWVAPQQRQEINTPPDAFMTWQHFMAHYTKRYGFHWLDGAPSTLKSVHTQPDETAPLTKVTFVQSMRPLHVRGNWMLVELRDVAEERPIGWLRWRTEDGHLLIWPNFTHQAAFIQGPSNPINPTALFEKF
jgi:hypothetical protein